MNTRATFLTTLLLLIASTSAYAQGYWELLTPPIPQGGYITALHALDDSTLIIAGNASVGGDIFVMRSGDGGDSWLDVTQNTNIFPLSPNSVYSITSFQDTLYLGTQELYQSVDRGFTWQQYGTFLGAVFKITLDPVSHVGYMPSSTATFIKTTDGWQTNQSGFTSFTSQQYRTVEQIGRDTVLLGGEQITSNITSQMARSADGGQSWTKPSGIDTGGAIRCIECVGQTCYAGGSRWAVSGGGGGARFYKSTDAGATWVSLLANLPDTGYIVLNECKCVDKDNCIIQVSGVDTSYFARIYRTTDGGATWKQDSLSWLNLPTPISLSYIQSLRYLNPSTAYAYGLISGLVKEGYVLRYTLPVTSVAPSSAVSVVVSPNPSSNGFTIELNGLPDAIFSLASSLGQVFINQRISQGPNTLNRGDLANGLYPYTITAPSGQVVSSGTLVLQ